ncbi:hypothetical protein AM228_20725 [Planktothricoides sp. SR001]|nr:hypothetical protein AM228_20725 [Planktothricoides sp. SR001]
MYGMMIVTSFQMKFFQKLFQEVTFLMYIYITSQAKLSGLLFILVVMARKVFVRNVQHMMVAKLVWLVKNQHSGSLMDIGKLNQVKKYSSWVKMQELVTDTSISMLIHKMVTTGEI